MTKVAYILKDGTMVNTYAEAVASGLSYKTEYSKIEVPRVKGKPIKESRRVKAIVK